VTTFDSPTPPDPASTQRSLPIGPPILPPSSSPLLRGSGAVVGRRLIDYATALVQAPAGVVEDIHRRAFTLSRLTTLVVVTMIITGLVVAGFSGGAQLWIVPIKLSLGMLACALLCLPSLYIFSSLAGAAQSLRETAAALLMGVALMGVLLVGLAPVSWLFSQTTSSPAVMGGLHITALLVASYFGLGLVRRVLGALNDQPLSGMGGWSFMFVLVLLQMTTTLRPLVGPYEGALLGSKRFFLTHWAQTVADEPGARHQ
jgi:hypothetical protein